ncbi:MAG TPA: MBL fold metallo-hydrolase [Bryobacteraceae bacterium]|nr:MBL fold metallo-hydrolase [Bryobacteraceae bacterium]
MRKNTLWIRTWIAAIAVGGLWVAMTQQPPQQPLTVEKLADDLHVIVGSGGNVGVLTTAEGVILVDDKFDRNVPEILEKVRSITDKPVRYVVNTHHHGDHSGGNTTLIRSAAAIVAHDNVYTNMVKGEQPGPPQITFSDKAYVRLGGKALRAHHFGRGHTNGDAVILFTAHRVIHMGDLFVAGTPFIDYAGGGSAVEWTKTIDKALTLDFDRVIPGHGPIMTKAELGKWNDTFKALRSKASELKRKGVTKEEMANQLKLEEFGWKASANWGRSVPSLYDEL